MGVCLHRHECVKNALAHVCMRLCCCVRWMICMCDHHTTSTNHSSHYLNTSPSYRQYAGSDVFPTYRPPTLQFMPNHEFDITDKVVDAICPANCNTFDQTYQYHRNGCSVPIEKLQPIHATLMMEQRYNKHQLKYWKASCNTNLTFVTNSMELAKSKTHDANVTNSLYGRSLGYSSITADIIDSNWTNCKKWQKKQSYCEIAIKCISTCCLRIEDIHLHSCPSQGRIAWERTAQPRCAEMVAFLLPLDTWQMPMMDHR